MKKTRKDPVVFQLHAPTAHTVFLAGSFNQWDPTIQPMTPDGKGTWKAAVTLMSGTYEYRFVVDGEWWEDPACEKRYLNAFGTYNSLVQI